MYVEPTDADETSCPYIEGNRFTQRYSVLKDLTITDFDFMLTSGWRHFGYYFFIPNCSNCSKCTPLRTTIREFKPTKSQRRNLKKNQEVVTVEFCELKYSDEIFYIYEKHSKEKFNQTSSRKDFKESFFSDALSGNSMMSKYWYESKLVGVGFIDLSKDGISSVYFCYDTDYSSLGLGVFSAIKEIEYGRELGRKYYYMGYYIEGNRSMEYKKRYTPCEYLDWNSGEWFPFK